MEPQSQVTQLLRDLLGRARPGALGQHVGGHGGGAGQALRVGPAAGAVHRYPLKQPRVQGQVRRESPGSKAETGIGKLHWILEKAVEGDPGARIRLQRGIAALKEEVVRRDPGADAVH